MTSFAETLGARIVFTQLKNNAVLEPLKEHGLKEVKLNASKSDIDNLRAQEQLLKHIENLDKKQNSQENKDYNERQQLAVEQYFKLSQKNTLLITLNHTERMTLNSIIREKLKKTDKITGLSQNVNMLRPLNMSLEEKLQLHLYQPGDVIRFNKEFGAKIPKSSYFTVYRVDLESKYIELRDNKDQTFWNPDNDKKTLRHVEVFKTEQREIQKGDTLIWNRSSKDQNKKGLDKIKGEVITVSEINKSIVSVTLANGQGIKLDLQKYENQHWDYGYTVHLKDANLEGAQSVVLNLQSKQIDEKNIKLLNDLFDMLKEQGIKTTLICNDTAELQKAIAEGRHRDLQFEPVEAPYKREEALYHYQLLATQPLFNRLQSEFLKVKELNPEFLPENLEKV